MSVLAGLLSAVGALGPAAAMAVESVFPPIPSEVVLPLAASLVASGALSFLVAVLAATAGSVLGAWVLYAMGRFGGRPALLRLGPLRRIDEARLARAEAWFARRGDWLVVVGRLVPGLRAVVSIPAGTARMPLWRFTLLTAIGSLIWIQVRGLVGDYPGVAHLDADRVDVQDRIDRVDRPVLPGGDLLGDHVGDSGDRRRRHLGAVDLGQVGGDVPGGDAPRTGSRSCPRRCPVAGCAWARSPG
jgi:membrane protein DedA with SNARE-associated domain